ncbi:MAG: Rne/Rng family ribonuclease [Betaproteobacteria bacterium]|nr:Rne/Rng family ribonuclease [Betaproteobacteria bacterium]
MKRMLFNATQQEELRVAIVDGQKLIDIDIETTGREQRKSNIYKGVITRIEPSLEACFVNYGEERHGFLPYKEVARSYFREGADVRNASIRDALREGQEIMVQVEKEERGNKGAALNSFISLAGRYLVLMPNNPRGGGVSRRVEGEDRQELRETMDKLDLPQGMSVIARTAGIGRNVDELQWDLNYLMQLWGAIDGASKSASGAFLIYQESSLVIRAIRDYFQPDIGEILIDTDDIYEQAQQFMSHVMPDMVQRVKRYRDDVPLFSRFQIEHQIESAYSRMVALPSGGAIVIDHTEALVSVDVNSARATRGSDIETTAFNTNLEAADEVARQLRLRDLGGLIVIDFIDMENAKNQREIENRLKDALHYDRARVQMGKISRFGLMELSRQRLRPSLSEGSHVTCPRCNGTGHIRDTDSSALQVLRIIQEEAMKENSAAIHVQVPVDVAAFLLNEKRGEILKIETRHRVSVVLIPNKHLETPHYKFERLKHDDPRLDATTTSYAMAEEPDTDVGYSKRKQEESKPRQEAVVKTITPDQPAPVVDRRDRTTAARPAADEAAEGFLSRLFGLLRKKPGAPAEAASPAKAPSRERNDRGGRSGRGRGRGGRGRDKQEERTGAEAKAPKEQCEPKENKEACESKEAANQRQPKPPREPREAGEGRQRQPLAPREERKPVQADETVLATPVTGLDHDAVQTDLLSPQTEGAAVENGEDAPRRRRRRGGRNRNRRDRTNGEAMPGDQDGEFGEGSEVSEAAQMSGSSHEVHTTPSFQEQLVAQPSSVNAEVPATAAHVAIPAATEVATTEVAVTEPMVQTATEASPPSQPAADHQAVANEVEASITQSETVPTQAVSSEAAERAAPVPVHRSSSADIDTLLREAGLTMAVTDPAKLRAMQAVSDNVTPKVRVPRERKPVPPMSNEPLVQVETQR